MTLTETLQQIRTLYVDEFSARLAAYPANVRQALLAEALYIGAKGEPLRAGGLQLPARGDVCVLQDQRVQEIACIDASRSVRFEAFRFVWRNRLQVALNPFSWSNCTLCIPEPLEALNVDELANWFMREVKPELRAGRGAHSLLEVVHSMSLPRTAADGVRFEIDFGSMPVTGIETFLNACAQSGAGLLVIGNGAPADPRLNG